MPFTTSDDGNAFLELTHKINEAGRIVPLLEVCEADNLIELTVELPGVAEDDIEVSLVGDVITIHAEKRGRNEKKRVHFSERSYGQFQRSIQLPFAPDPDTVKADLQNGILIVRVPRVEAQRSRRIEIGGTRSDETAERSAIGSQWDDESSQEEPLNLTERAHD